MVRIHSHVARLSVPIPALKEVGPAGLHPDEAAPEDPKPTETPEEETMLLPKQTLSEAARKQYALFTNPFDGEVTSDAQMFINGEIRFVHETAWQAAVGGRMVAVIGESGAGKTTMLDDLKEKIVREHRPVVCIEPSVEGMEETDTKGKSIKSAEIHAAIVLTLDANASVAQSSEKRSRQVKRMLEESVQSGRSHLLIIEEAHALPVPTLNHLKRLHEKMRLGRRPMLGILLVGHHELEKKLNRFDVREVMQRTEIARLRPLGADLSTYLQLRASAAGRKARRATSCRWPNLPCLSCRAARRCAPWPPMPLPPGPTADGRRQHAEHRRHVHHRRARPPGRTPGRGAGAARHGAGLVRHRRQPRLGGAARR